MDPLKNLGWNLYKVGKALAKKQRGYQLLVGYKSWKGEQPEENARDFAQG